jgi:hypothetical protein
LGSSDCGGDRNTGGDESSSRHGRFGHVGFLGEVMGIVSPARRSNKGCDMIGTR